MSISPIFYKLIAISIIPDSRFTLNMLSKEVGPGLLDIKTYYKTIGIKYIGTLLKNTFLFMNK